MRSVVSYLCFGVLPALALGACVSPSSTQDAVAVSSYEVDFNHPAFNDPRPDGFEGASETVPPIIAQRARDIAERSALLRTPLDARVVYVGTDFLSHKMLDEKLSRAIYRVLFYRYSDDAALITDVDIESGEILEQGAYPGRPVRLSEEEMEEVRALVLENREAQTAIGEALSASGLSREDVAIEGLIVRTRDAKDPFHGRRIVRALIRIDRDYLHEPLVIVDLTAREVSIERARGR